MKFWNNILLSTVLLLFIVAIVTFIKVLTYGASTMEIGSVTDWISALSTFGTLVVAYIALRKAPDWLAQKHYEKAFSAVEDSIFNELYNVRSSSLKLKEVFTRLSGIYIRSITAREDVPFSHLEAMQELTVYTTDFQKRAHIIINQIKAISRTRYEITGYTESILDILVKTSEKYNDLDGSLFISTGEACYLKDADDAAIQITVKELRSIQKQAIETHKELSVLIIKIYDDNKPIDDFINFKKK